MLDVNSSDEARVAPLRILVGADPDVLRCSVERGLADRIAARTDGEIAAVVDVLPVGRADSLLARVRADPTLFATADVVVCSLAPELMDGRPGAQARTRFRSAMAELITLLSQTGVYVVVLNGSTVVPDDVAHCYRDGEETPALIMHRLNAALMELAAGEGISILDADRVIAELGGERHVTGLLSYSDVANDALCAELVSILKESGYLDGRARRASESQTDTGSALRLEMVAHTVAVRAGRVRRWRVAEGASFARGDGLVDIDVTEWSTLARRRTRPHMGSADERRDRLTFDAPRRPTIVHIVARERGVLARVTAPVGTPVAIGDLLAVVGVSEDPGPWASAPPPGGPTLQTGAVRFRERADRVEIDESRAASTPAPSPQRKAAVSHSTLYTRCKRIVPKPLRRRARSLLRRFREKPRHPGAAA